MTSTNIATNQKVNQSPFIDANNPPLIVHCCHHKVATVWFLRIFEAIAKHYNLKLQRCKHDALQADTHLFLQDHSEVDIAKLPKHKGTHIIRDPRDIIISGYFFHLWTPEKWVHKSNKKYGDLSYQQYLNSLDFEQGILAEMERFSGKDYRGIIDWNYNLTDFIEIKYEELIKNPKVGFTNIFNHYGFKQSAIDVSLEIVEQYSFKKLSQRSVGEVQAKSHLRSGRPGEWKELFSEQHKQKFKDIFGDALIKLGYETNNDW